MGSQSWTVAEAKAKFSEIIEKAMSEGPQTITRKGRTAAVVVGQRNGNERQNALATWQNFLPHLPCEDRV